MLCCSPSIKTGFIYVTVGSVSMSPNNFCFVQCFDWVEDENFTHQPPSQPHQLGFPRMQLRRMTKKLVRFFRPIGVRKNVIGGGNSPMKKNRQVPSSAWHFDDHAQKIENRFKNLWKKYQQIFRIQTWLESTKHLKKNECVSYQELWNIQGELLRFRSDDGSTRF